MVAELHDCIGRITRPLLACASCLKNQDNLRCVEYKPVSSIELILVEPNEYILEEDIKEYTSRLDNNLK